MITTTKAKGSKVIKFPGEEREFLTRLEGDAEDRHFIADIKPSPRKKGTCRTCGGKVRRSWRTGILWRNCGRCRYLIFLYGPSIKVERVERED